MATSTGGVQIIAGTPGPANQLTIGTVTEGEASATLTTLSPSLQRLDLALPRGGKGDAGEVDFAAINTPALRFDQFPVPLTDATPINGSVTVRQVGDWIYAVFWSEDMNPYVAKMKNGDTVWQTFNLATIPGNPLNAPAPADEHNMLAIIIDGAGYIHISGNHHRVPLNYIRSAVPNEIAYGWEAPGMVGTNELEVTYPEFRVLSDGNLLFFYRDGTSSDGDLMLNKYTTSTKTWTRVGMILKGHDWATAADDVSAYGQVFYDPIAGRLHLWWVWRDTITIDSNFDLCYMYSTDNGMTWKNAAGAAVATPVTPAETTVKVFAGGSGHIVTGTRVDLAGNAQAIVRMADGEVRHYKRLGSSITYTSLGAGMGSTDIAVTPDGKMYGVYNLADAPYIRQISPTLGDPVKLASWAVQNWTPRLATMLQGSYTLRLLVAPARRKPGGNWGGVLSFDLTAANVAALAAGKLTLPKPRPLAPMPDPTRHSPGSYGMMPDMCYGPAGPRALSLNNVANGSFKGALMTAARAGKIVEATINVTTAGAAGAKVRIVAYRTDGKLVAQSADIDVSTSGQKTIAFVCNIGKNEQYVLGTLQHSSTGASAIMTAVSGQHDSRIPFSSPTNFFTGVKSGWSLAGVPVPAVDTTSFLEPASGAAQPSNDNTPMVVIKCGARPGDWSTPE